jgi:D-glycero-alpha-D-manno-heptose 1-phosphate guanylyltransferase
VTRSGGPTAAILAGGLGTRLRSVVADRPKALALVAGRPVVTYLLDQLAAAGIVRCVLCTGHLGHQVEDALGSSYGCVALEYSREVTPRGTAGALRDALPRLGQAPLFVLNGDSYCRANLRAVHRAHEASGVRASLVVVQVPDAGRFGRVTLSDDDRVAGFEEKSLAGGAGWVNAGIYLLDPSLLTQVPVAPAIASLERDVLPRLAGRGLLAHRSPGPFLDIGTPAAYAEADAFFGALGGRAAAGA